MKLAVEYDCSRTGGAHPSKLRMLARMFLNRSMCILKRRSERLARIALRVIQISVAHGPHRDGAGQLATFVPAHPVRHHRQSAFFLKVQVVLRLGVTIVILVLSAVTTDIGEIR